MQKLIICTFLLSLLSTALSALFQTPCDRYICLSQPNSQDTNDLYYTGIQPSHGVCVWKVAQSSGSNSNYYLQECMYPKYACSSGTSSSDNQAVGVCVLSSPFSSQDQTTTQNQQNGLYDGEWCLSNNDCASGLCDALDNKALLQVPLSTQYKVIQNRTNKCYVRQAGDVCTMSNNYRYHQQCDKGLRCARNDSTTYTCQAALAVGSNCTANTVYAAGGGSNSWERCAFGSDCIVTSGSNQYTCQAWFSLADATSFNYITSYTNNDYTLSQTIFSNIDALGSWINQANRMCNSTVSAASTLAGYTYACQTAQTTTNQFGTICGNDTYCQGTQAAGATNPQCSCAFFNQDGNAYCRGFVGNTDWFNTTGNQTWQGYFSNQSSFNSCYPYEIWNQFAVTNQTQCNIPEFTFANPAPNRTIGNCYDAIGHPSSLTRPSNIAYWQNTIMTQTTKIPNFPITSYYSFLPSNYWFNYLPNKQAGNYVGKCPQFLCEQIWVELPQLTGAVTASTKIPAKKGACAYYDELANIWSIQNCRSPYDFCQVCLPAAGNAYHASSGVTTTSEANIQMCGGYSVTQLTQSAFAGGSALPKAWKCQRSDGTLKRIFDYCWDNFDCLSGLCDSTGECAVLVQGQICELTIQCDKNLVCAYHNSTDNTLTCQPAIPAGQTCTIDTYSRCKLGSKCVQIRGEQEARCTNFFSLSGLTVFSFLDTRMPNYANQQQTGGIEGTGGIPSELQGAFNMMCSTGAYSNSADNSQLYVDYEGCLHFTKTTRGGWPKECFKNSYDCQSVQSFNFIRNNYDSSKTITLDGTCNCVKTNGIFSTGTNAYDLFNQGGLGYCEGFPGEKDNSLFQMRRTYEQDFVNCYPYEVLKNTDTLQAYQGWLAIGGECGYIPQIKYNPMPLKPFPKCYRNIFIDRSNGWKNVGTLYYLWRRCPQYACVTTLDQDVCRYYNESTQVVSLQACASGESCNQFNGTYYLCDYTTPILKDIGAGCYFDIECKTQVCGARDAEGNPDYTIKNRQCTTIPNGQVCQVHQNCLNDSRCVSQIKPTGTGQNVTYNYTVSTNNSYGSVCLPALIAGATCQATMPDQCKYGSQCVKLYNAVNYTCVNYYSLTNGTKIQEPTITNTAVYADVKTQTGALGELGRLCENGYYFLDQWTAIQGTMQISGGSGCATRKLGSQTATFTGFPHPCLQDIDCNSTYQQSNTTRYEGKQSEIGVCNCSYWNNWGYGYCNAFETDDQSFLNATKAYYGQNFSSCYPYQYLDEYTINNSTTTVEGCNLPNWGNWHSHIYVTTNGTDANNHSYYSTSFGNDCYQQVGMSLWSGTWQIQQPSQNQSYPYFCPQYSCVGSTYKISTDGVDWAICRHYSTYEQSFWLLRACTDDNNVCTQYNETVWVCERQDGKLKGQGETCFNGGQCMSQICDLGITPTAGKCNVRNVSEPCTVHENCDKNLRCDYFTWQQKEDLSGQTKYCQTAIPANAICTPFTAGLCRYGTTCALINSQPTPICIPWYSLPAATNVSIISNYSSYPQVNYYSTLQTMYSELCQSGLYDPSYGCLPSQEITAQGWPSSCSSDSDCVGLYYGTPGSCTCDNKNQDGVGYCKGFDGEANNKTQSWFLSYQRSFVNCYPYQIDNEWSVDSDCNFTNYSTYDSAPYESIGGCYAAVGIQSKISNITKPTIIEDFVRVVQSSAMILQALSILLFIAMIF